MQAKISHLHTLRAATRTAAFLSVAAGLAFLSPAPVWAQDASREATPAAEGDPRIDPQTGRAIARWPHSRPFDFQHLTLDLTIPSMSEPKLYGQATYTATAVGRARDVMVLNSNGPEVTKLSVNGVPATFEQVESKGPSGTPEHLLIISMPTPVPAGQSVTVTIAYSLNFGKNKGDGLTYSKGREGAKSATVAYPQIHAQGQAELNQLWFPCHDFPNDRLTTEVILTTEDGYEVVSNGKLLSKETLPGIIDLPPLPQPPATDGGSPTLPPPPALVRWHWSQDKPHAVYLVTLAIAKFAKIEVGGPESARPGLPMPVYGPAGSEDNMKMLFKNTPAMVKFFEEKFDEPYPWDMYAQVLVRDFTAGGMENTSCTLLTARTVRSEEEGSEDDLISHELAHQWFGDLITCKSWDHIWLNEGWATFAEGLWIEESTKQNASPSAARDAYIRWVIQTLRGQRRSNRGSAPDSPPLVSNRYLNPDSTFQKPDDPYAKGGLVLHMLRERLGDDVFFKGVRLYIDRFKYGSVETDDFCRVLEEVSGQSLERFFEQWTMRPGLPRLASDVVWNESTSTLDITIEQTQKIDRLNPAYAFSLPVVLKFADGSIHRLNLETDREIAKLSTPLAAKPVQVTFDPSVTVAAPMELRTKLTDSPSEPAPTGANK